MRHNEKLCAQSSGLEVWTYFGHKCWLTKYHFIVTYFLTDLIFTVYIKVMLIKDGASWLVPGLSMVNPPLFNPLTPKRSYYPFYIYNHHQITTKIPTSLTVQVLPGNFIFQQLTLTSMPSPCSPPLLHHRYNSLFFYRSKIALAHRGALLE